jgi:hypothetical protein
MADAYEEELDDTRGIHLFVEFERDRAQITDYAVILVARVGTRLATVRLYDGAHGRNEMHRYTRKLGKRPAEVFHRGTLGEGMRTAIAEIKRSYDEMIEGWHRG